MVFGLLILLVYVLVKLNSGEPKVIQRWCDRQDEFYRNARDPFQDRRLF